MKNINVFKYLYFNWWRNIDKILFSLILIFFILGLFFSLVSTSLVASDRLNTNSYLFFFKHLIFISIGFTIIFFISYLDQNKLLLISKILFLICLFALILVPIFGTEVKGSKRWIEILFLP